eukprot:CAMPEP_0170079628 /NCGR_PEP_ID=MMETSP0019_2-20121128/15952_1 /TAXON_ID=98059 /ORGANISM="Dinobryon sp., Strain UTEXLB2267" /LENGTH=134 /DNA_ID=CAMNT_0010293161 /DNA_START=277 /DNA_END=681 /DNA_ORIENTATION=+
MTKKVAKTIVAEFFSEINLLFQWFQNRCTIISQDDTDTSKHAKPSFLKDLNLIFKEFLHYHSQNTILMDDSMEKCVLNSSFSCIHPLPYSPVDNIADHDTELIENGKLFAYLDLLSQSTLSNEEFSTINGTYSY